MSEASEATLSKTLIPDIEPLDISLEEVDLSSVR